MSSGASGAPPKSIGHYVLMKTIGEGTFGKVKLGTHILTGERVAVKVLEKERIVEAADVERVAREIHILKVIRKCRHIIQLYEIIETPRQLYLIMEYAPGGELFDYIVERGRAEELQACRFLHQILAGVERVHEHRVVHRDLKPENLLLTDKKDIKIVDFGLSNTHKEGELLHTACGSPCYAAPEMIASQKYHPPMVDIWSCGVILFALVCGCLPFEDQNQVELYRKICSAEYEMPDFVSNEVADLIRGMLTTDPNKRLTLAGIREHRWYRQIPEASLKDFEDDGVLEDAILEQLDALGFPRDYSVRCLLGNKHNHLTTTYYLLKEKRFRESDARGHRENPHLAELECCGLEEQQEEDPFRAFDADPQQQRAAVAAVATPSRGARVAEGNSANGSAAHSVGRHREGPPGGAHEEPDAEDEEKEVETSGGARSSANAQALLGVPRLNLGGLEQEPMTSAPEDPAAAAAAYAEMAQASAQASRRPATARGARPGGGYGEPSVASSSRRPAAAGAGQAPGDGRPLTARGGYARGGSGGNGCYRDGYVSAHSSAASRRRPSEPCPAGGGSATARGGYAADGYGDRGWYASGSRHSQASPRQRRATDAPTRPSAYGVTGGGYVAGVGRLDSSAEVGELAQHGAGMLQVLCRDDAHPRRIMGEVCTGLAAIGANYRQMSQYTVRMQEESLRVQAEVLPLAGRGFVVRFSRASGPSWHFKDLCERLVAHMRF